MRIVIDMQGAQVPDNPSGIAQRSLQFAKKLVQNRGEHDIVLALSALLPEAIEPIRSFFNDLLPQTNIQVWHSLGPVMECDAGNKGFRNIAELVREAFLASLKPDVICVTGIFEGYIDDVVVSVSRLEESAPRMVLSYKPVQPPNCDDSHWQAFLQHRQSLLDGALLTLSFDEDIETVFQFWTAICATSCAKNIALWQNPKPKLAFVSPFPPQQSGIADYSAEVIPQLSELYEIDLVSLAVNGVDSSLGQYGRVRTASWLLANRFSIDHVLYQMGNSPFHADMVHLLEEVPGTVVLHDFFLGDLMFFLESRSNNSTWRTELYQSHGFMALKQYVLDRDLARLKYPVNWSILESAIGVIVHTSYAKQLALQCYHNATDIDIAVLSLPRSSTKRTDRQAARRQLGLNRDDFVVATFGQLGDKKLGNRLLSAWLDSSLAADERCHLYFVGNEGAESYCRHLREAIRASGIAKRIHITGYVSPVQYHCYLASSDIGVQLRSCSRGEASAAALDCMIYDVPLIVNAHGSMVDLDASTVYMLPDEFSNEELAEALESLWKDAGYRASLGLSGHNALLNEHDVHDYAQSVFDSIEKFQRVDRAIQQKLVSAVASQEIFSPDDPALLGISMAIANTFPQRWPEKNFYVDVSVVYRNDLKTGIQRVVRALVHSLLECPPKGYRLQPVYLSDEGGAWHYRLANKFSLELIDFPSSTLSDEPLWPQSSEILLLLDFAAGMVTDSVKAGLYDFYRMCGVRCVAIVYDLLPVQMPDAFPFGVDYHFSQWLHAISTLDGAICISKSAANDLVNWQNKVGFTWENRRSFSVEWFHLGSDVLNSAPTRGLPNDSPHILRFLSDRPTFVMVGTVEPRKGHLQVLEAFAELWDDGNQINLVIIGKEGWKGSLSDDPRSQVFERLRTMQKRCEYLLWLEGVSDEFLEEIYSASNCLIAASYGEGFGLPLIEAARHGLSICARDISVFREVAGDYAYFFNADTPSELAHEISNWLQLYSAGRHPSSVGMPWLTWSMSASQLVSKLIHEN